MRELEMHKLHIVHSAMTRQSDRNDIECRQCPLRVIKIILRDSFQVFLSLKQKRHQAFRADATKRSYKAFRVQYSHSYTNIYFHRRSDRELRQAMYTQSRPNKTSERRGKLMNNIFPSCIDVFVSLTKIFSQKLFWLPSIIGLKGKFWFRVSSI